MDRVIFQEMGERRGIRNVIDRHDLQLPVVERCAQKHPANPAEPVDSDPDRHWSVPP
jgi:hypothetical protein